MNMIRGFGFVPLLLAVAVPAAAAAKERSLECKLTFSSREWSVLYTSAVGEGMVSCKDGAKLAVSIRAKGVGITAGKWKIDEGKGTFTHVREIEDVLGHYAALGADAGLSKAGSAKVLTKGKVSLALAGKGEGWDIGIAVSEFTIDRADTPSH